MTRLKPLLRMHLLDIGKSFVIFWSILFSLFLISNLLLIFTANEKIYNAGGIISSNIYFMIVGFTLLKSSFGFALGMSATRRDYYFSLLIAWGIIAAANAVILFTFHMIEKQLMPMFTNHIFHYFTPSEQFSSPLLLWIGFVFPLVIGGCAFFISCVHYRFGNLGILTFFFIGLILGALLSIFKLWHPLFDMITTYITGFESFTVWVLLIAIVAFAASWLLLRKAPVKAAV